MFILVAPENSNMHTCWGNGFPNENDSSIDLTVDLAFDFKTFRCTAFNEVWEGFWNTKLLPVPLKNTPYKYVQYKYSSLCPIGRS